MSFLNSYKISKSIGGPPSAVLRQVNIAPGIYNDGLLTVLDDELAIASLIGWRWLLGHDVVALATTAFGDLFFWSDKHNAIYFLEVQKGQSTFIDREINYLFDVFLVNEGIRADLLREDELNSLTARLGAISYGECYIANPWKMLGGTGDLETYELGQLDVYLNLVGHAVQQNMDNARKES